MTGPTQIGTWTASDRAASFDGAGLIVAALAIREPAHIVQDPNSGQPGVGLGGGLNLPANGVPQLPVLATLPAIYPEWLGSRGFTGAHGLRFPYVSGAMANGIATVALCVAMAETGCMGFFGAAGLDPDRVAQAIDALQARLGDRLPWGSNLIHSPQESALEMAVAELYLKRGVRRVSAAAFMKLEPSVVRISATGLRQLPSGEIVRRNFVFAKLSRPEVARHFLAPAPMAMLQPMVDKGWLTADEARLASTLPVAHAITVEADSGGHTDNRPLTALFPTIFGLRDSLALQTGHAVYLGAAGGLGTPAAVAAAFALGADYVLTGSVNQSCVESGLHPSGREMLARAGLADVVMAPAADMFELGVEVQVLKRGTMFAVRGRRLYELYRAHAGLADLPVSAVQFLEREVFRGPLSEAVQSTLAYWAARDPRQVDKAASDPKHEMALVFRAYLGQASRWAIHGQADRGLDYQIWCGPAMGAFNAWVQGSFLETPANRAAAEVARNLLEGAAVITRAQQLRSSGVPMPSAAFDFRPRPLT